ncbi:CLUMA_CG020389, isoform A [Clunio marinus]|uniref:CLUMA_CG020389, isoform A n=1 Tax=Clunio marinus TaxID=568069 RepID=A0A1J1J4T5_9DIPT|nr:CLUMA_CG020389, isoform A [Clunio marinus]
MLLCHFAAAVPKQYDGNDQSSNSYPNNNWRRRTSVNETESAASERLQRLGSIGGLTTGYGNTVGSYGYGSGIATPYGKPAIEIGAVILGVIIGIGALLILPKIAAVIVGHGALGGYYRTNDESGIADIMNKFDDFLAQHNIDSNACMQKAVCHFVRSADYHTSVGTADQMEAMISSISENSIIDYVLDGTAIKDAIENGKNPTGRECDSIYQACPLDRQSALQMMKKFLPLPGKVQASS